MSKWFIDRELFFGFGFALSFNRVGSAISGWIAPPLYEIHEDIFFPIFVLDIFLGISLLMTIFLYILDKKSDE